MAETGTNTSQSVQGHRSFGTDLTPSASSWVNRNTSVPPKGTSLSSKSSLTKRIDRSASSSSSTTKKSQLHRKTLTSVPKLSVQNHGTPLSRQLLLQTPIAQLKPRVKAFLTQQQRTLNSGTKSEPRRSASKEYYDVTFPSGPLGLQLEPMTSTTTSIHDQGDKQQMGCRVAAILSADAEGEPLAKNKKERIAIQEGDVLVAINRQTIVTWPYERTIQHLKAILLDHKKRITFRRGHNSVLTSFSTTKKKERFKETQTILPMFELRQNKASMVSPEVSNLSSSLERLAPEGLSSTLKSSRDNNDSNKERTLSPSKVKKLSWRDSEEKSEKVTFAQNTSTPPNATSGAQSWLLSTPNWDLHERGNTDIKAKLMQERGFAKLAQEQPQQTAPQHIETEKQNQALQLQIEEQQLALSQLTTMQSELEKYIQQETPMFKTPRSTLKSPLSCKQENITLTECQADLKTPQSLFPNKSVETDTPLSNQTVFSTPILKQELQKIKDTIETILRETKGSIHIDANNRVSQVKAELEITKDCMQKEADDRVAALEKELQATKELMQKSADDRAKDMEKAFQVEKDLMEKELNEAREAIQMDADTRVSKLKNELLATKYFMQNDADNRVATVEEKLRTTKESMQKKADDRVEDMEEAFQAEKALMEKDFNTTKETIQKDADIRVAKLENELQETKDCMQKEADDRVAAVEKELQLTKESMRKHFEDRVEDMEKTFKAEKALLRNDFDTSRETIQNHADIRVTELENKVQELEATRDFIQQRADDCIAAVKKELKTTKESMQKSSDDRVIDMKKAFQEEKDLIENEAKANEEVIQKYADTRITELEEKLQEVEATKECMQKEANDRVVAFEEELQTTKESMQKNADVRVECMKKAFQEEKALMETEFQSTREEILQDVGARVAEFENKLRELEETKDYMQKEADDRVAALETELQSIEESMQKDADNRVENIKEAFLGEKTRMEKEFDETKEAIETNAATRIAELEDKLRELETSKKCTQKEAENCILKLKGELQATKDAMQKSADDRMMRAEEEFEVIKTSMENEAEDRVANVKRELASIIESMQKDMDNNAIESERKLQATKDGMQKEAEDRVANLVDKVRAAKNSIQENAEIRVAKLEKEHQVTMESLQKDHDDRIANLETEIQELQETKELLQKDTDERIAQWEGILKETKDSLSGEATVLMGKVTELQLMLTSKEIIEKKTKILIGQMEKELQETKQSMADQSVEMKELQLSFEMKDQELNNANSLIFQLEDKQKETRLFIEHDAALSAKLIQDLRLSIETKESRNDILNMRVKQAEKEIMETRNSIQKEADAKVVILEEKIQMLTESMQSEKEGLESIIEGKDTTQKETMTQNLQLQSELKIAKDKISNLEQELVGSQESMQKDIDNRMTQVEVLRNVVETTVESQKDSGDRILKLEKELKESYEVMKKKELMLVDTHQQVINLLNDSKDLTSKLEAASAQLVEQEHMTEQQYLQQKEEIDTITKAYDAQLAQTESERYETTQRLEAKIFEIKEALQEEKNKSLIKINEKRDADATIEQLESRIVTLTDEIRDKNDALEILSTQVSKLNDDLQASNGQIYAKDDTIFVNETKLSELKKELQASQDECQATNLVLISLRTQIGDLESRVENFQNFLANEKTLSQKITEKLDSEGRKSTAKDNTITDLREKIVSLALQVDSFQENTSTLESDKQSRIVQLETFLQDAVQHVETRGEETRKLNSDLFASQEPCKEFSKKLLASENIISDLEEYEIRLAENMESEKEAREKFEIEKESQSNLIKTLNCQLASARQIMEEQCSIKIEELENHVVHLEVQIMNVVKSSLSLEDAFTAKERELECAQEIIDDLHITTKDLRAREKSLRQEFEQCSKSKRQTEERLLDTQLSHNAVILELEGLRDHTEEVEFQLEKAELEERNRKMINESIEKPEARQLSESLGSSSTKTDERDASHKKDYSELLNELRHTKSELESAKKNFQLEESDWNEVVESLQVECQALHAALEDKKKQVKQLEEELNEDEAAAMADRILWYQRQHEILTAELKTTRESLVEAEEESESVQQFLKAELTKARHTMKDQDEAAEFLHKRVFELENYKEFAQNSDGYDDTDSFDRSRSSERPVRLRAAAMLMDNVLNQQEQTELERALRQWSHSVKTIKAVSQHMHVAQTMARQLETTRETLRALKSHFKINTPKISNGRGGEGVTV